MWQPVATTPMLISLFICSPSNHRQSMLTSVSIKTHLRTRKYSLSTMKVDYLHPLTSVVTPYRPLHHCINDNSVGLIVAKTLNLTKTRGSPLIRCTTHTNRSTAARRYKVNFNGSSLVLTAVY